MAWASLPWRKNWREDIQSCFQPYVSVIKLWGAELHTKTTQPTLVGKIKKHQPKQNTFSLSFSCLNLEIAICKFLFYFLFSTKQYLYTAHLFSICVWILKLLNIIPFVMVKRSKHFAVRVSKVALGNKGRIYLYWNQYSNSVLWSLQCKNV